MVIVSLFPHMEQHFFDLQRAAGSHEWLNQLKAAFIRYKSFLANSLPLFVCFCVGIVSVITVLLRWLCKLIIHTGCVTYPRLTHIDTLRLCQRLQVTTRKEEALLKGV